MIESRAHVRHRPASSQPMPSSRRCDLSPEPPRALPPPQIHRVDGADAERVRVVAAVSAAERTQQARREASQARDDRVSSSRAASAGLTPADAKPPGEAPSPTRETPPQRRRRRRQARASRRRRGHHRARAASASRSEPSARRSLLELTSGVGRPHASRRQAAGRSPIAIVRNAAAEATAPTPNASKCRRRGRHQARAISASKNEPSARSSRFELACDVGRPHASRRQAASTATATQAPSPPRAGPPPQTH